MTVSESASMNKFVAEHSVIVVVGAGGVGKTSAAAALGSAAATAGRRTCVITVDPARRLADAMGGCELGPEPQQVLSTDAGGELWAMMLDSKFTFDAIVRSHSRDEQQVADIVANSFYRKLSTTLPGVHEYMAVEQLYVLAHDHRFDLVVVDTPPSRHILDLLDAPDRLTRFLDNRMYRTLIRPSTGIARLASAPARAFTRRVAKVVGNQLLDDAVGFFEAFAGMEAGFVARARAVSALLREDGTAFAVVATPRRDAVETAIDIGDELIARGLRLTATVANMTTFDPWADLEPWLSELDGSPELRLRVEALRDRHARAEAEWKLLEPLRSLGTTHATARRRATEVADLDGLADLGAELLA